VILTFVGVKMVIVDFYHFPIVVSLGVIVATLTASILASLFLRPKYAEYERAQAQPHKKTGSVFGHSHEEHSNRKVL
jgi:predicted tellurium resistance membrane protein TerC